jgi:hypothetical protein
MNTSLVGWWPEYCGGVDSAESSGFSGSSNSGAGGGSGFKAGTEWIGLVAVEASNRLEGHDFERLFAQGIRFRQAIGAKPGRLGRKTGSI